MALRETISTILQTTQTSGQSNLTKKAALPPHMDGSRYNWLSYRFCNRFDNPLYRVNKHPTSCQTGWLDVCTTGLTAVLNEQPLFVQPVVKPGCTTDLSTGCIHDTAGCQTDNRLNVCIHDTTGCQTVLTTGCIV